MTCYCVSKCYYKARLWTPGEILEFTGEDQPVPEHFSAEKPVGLHPKLKSRAYVAREDSVELKNNDIRPLTFSSMTNLKPVEFDHSSPMAISQYGKKKK